MKRSTFISGAVLALTALAPGNLFADITSASKTLYDFSGWNNRAVLDLFVKAADEGRKFPTQEEFEAAGIYMELEFARSHVRYSPIITQSAETNLINSVYPTRRIWMNLPTGSQKITGGYPTSEFDSDVFSMWNYTHIFGSWNHGFMQAPGSWISAAHKNGAYMYSGIEFFDTTGGDTGDGAKFTNYVNMLNTKNEDGSFKYVDAILNCLIFLGQDGINYNFEAGSPTGLAEVHAALYKRAKEIGFDSFHIGSYTSNNYLSSYSVGYLLGNSTYGKVTDAFLNYAGGDFNVSSVSSSLSAAKTAMGTAEDVYQGAWIVTMDRNWIGMNQDATKEMNMVLWGEHSISRFFQYNVGTSTMNKQENYQILQDRTTGGGNRNVLNRPALCNSGNNFSVMVNNVDNQMTKYHGFASMAPERSAIKGDLPFSTNFTLGNGDIYFFKGKKSGGSWYNMGAQDYVPTYRWLLMPKGGDMTTASSDLDVRFTHEEAYIGGSSIRLTGKTSGADLVIYKTDLNVNGGVDATVAIKTGVVGDSHISLILQKENGTWVEVPYGQTTSTGWEEKTISVSDLALGDKIKHIGVRVADSDENYKVYLGQITLKDHASTFAPAPIDEDSFTAEVKEETAKSLSVKLAWEVNDNGYTCSFKDRGMVYNDEVNIDHFELFVKNGDDGKVFEVGRTSTWHGFIGNIDLETFSNPYVGVRAVSKDLESASPVVWLKIDRYANPSELPVTTEDNYLATYMDMTSDGLEKAFTNRWIEEVKTTGATGNLNYSRTVPAGDYDYNAGAPAEGNTNYVMADDVLTVTQGETVNVHIRGHEGSDDIRYCLFKAWLDWDIDYIFDGTGDEIVWEYGTQNHGAAPYNDGGTTREKFVTDGTDFTINVPADAKPGDSRLRIVACDAWFAGGLNATGGFNKGYALDIPVKILGTNKARDPKPSYLDYRDSGEAESPVLSGVNDISIDGNNGNVGFVNLNDNTIAFNNVDSAWIYNVNGQMVKHIGNVNGNVSIADLASGIYIVKMQNGQIIRSAKLIKK
jgi:hypothetical protein